MSEAFGPKLSNETFGAKSNTSYSVYRKLVNLELFRNCNTFFILVLKVCKSFEVIKRIKILKFEREDDDL